MKESKIIEIKNKVEALTRVSQHMYNEMAQIKDLAIGTLETIKKMDGYKEAIEDLKKDLVTKPEETKEKKFETDVE